MTQTTAQRNWRSVPRWCWWLAILALLLQLTWQYYTPPKPRPALWHTPAPAAALLQALSLGDSVGTARLLSLWLQGFDVHEGFFRRMNAQDYRRLTQWMTQLSHLDQDNQYLLLLATRVYSQTRQTEQQITMLEFVYEQFLLDPAQRWQWLVEATLQARHQLKNPDLALRYGQALSAYVPQVPADAASVYLFLLDDVEDFTTVRQLFTQWKNAGYLSDDDIKFLNHRLRALQP